MPITHWQISVVIDGRSIVELPNAHGSLILIIRDRHDGTRNIDAEKVFAKAIEMGKAINDGWKNETVVITPHPIQGRRE